MVQSLVENLFQIVVVDYLQMETSLSITASQLSVHKQRCHVILGMIWLVTVRQCVKKVGGQILQYVTFKVTLRTALFSLSFSNQISNTSRQKKEIFNTCHAYCILDLQEINPTFILMHITHMCFVLFSYTLFILSFQIFSILVCNVYLFVVYFHVT